MAVPNAPNAMEQERQVNSAGCVGGLKSVINVEVAESARLVMALQRVLYVAVMGIACLAVVPAFVIHAKGLAKGT